LYDSLLDKAVGSFLKVSETSRFELPEEVPEE
jgi:hypothetical protein